MTAGDGGYAFPRPEGALPEARAGMTLRDYFAGQALIGMGTWCPASSSMLLDPKGLASRARWAYEQADAMLAERAKAD